MSSEPVTATPNQAPVVMQDVVPPAIPPASDAATAVADKPDAPSGAAADSAVQAEGEGFTPYADASYWHEQGDGYGIDNVTVGSQFIDAGEGNSFGAVFQLSTPTGSFDPVMFVGPRFLLVRKGVEAYASALLGTGPGGNIEGQITGGMDIKLNNIFSFNPEAITSIAKNRFGFSLSSMLNVQYASTDHFEGSFFFGATVYNVTSKADGGSRVDEYGAAALFGTSLAVF